MRVQAGLVQVASLRKITTHLVKRVAQAVMTSRRPSLTIATPQHAQRGVDLKARLGGPQRRLHVDNERTRSSCVSCPRKHAANTRTASESNAWVSGRRCVGGWKCEWVGG